jgi:hypothetical protein
MMAFGSNSAKTDRSVKKNAVFLNAVQRKTEGGRTRLTTLFGYIGRKYIISTDKNQMEVKYFFISKEIYLNNPSQYREQLIMLTAEEIEQTLHDFLSKKEGFCEGLEKYDIKSMTVIAATI